MTRRGLFTYENALVLILGLTFGIVFFDRQAASNLMFLIKPDLKLDNVEVGLIGSVLSITWAASAYLVGLLSDRTGVRKLILIACVVGFSLCSVISGLAHSFAVLAASRVLMGMLEGGVMPICLAIMTVESQDSRRGLNAGLVQNGFSNLIGNAAGPVVLVALATTLSWRSAFYLAAVPGLLCAGAIALWVKEPAKEAHHESSAGPGMGLKQMLGIRNVWVCSLVSIFMVGWYITALSFLPIFLTEFRHIVPRTMSLLISSLGICAFLGGFLLPGLSDKIGRRPVMIVCCFAAVLTPLAALYFNGPLWILGGMMFVGWVGNGIFPLFMGTIPGESLPTRYIATAMGIVVGIGEIIGGFLSPTVAGWVADRTNLQAPLFMMTGLALIAGCIALLLKETAPAKVGGVSVTVPELRVAGPGLV